MKPLTIRNRIILVVAVCIAFGIGAAYLYFFGASGSGIPCVLNWGTGLYCAGCGTSRALYSLMHLRLYQALRYNPLLIVLLPFLAWYALMTVVHYIKSGTVYVEGKIVRHVVLLMAIIVVVYSIVRNIPVFPFVLLRPTMVLV